MTTALSFAEVSGQTESHCAPVTGESALLQPETAAAYLTMQQAALQDGVTLRIASGFRSLQRQLMIWNRKWQGESPLNDLNGDPLDVSQLAPEEILKAILHWSAVPGMSRHHWGTDLDVYDPTPFASGERSLQLTPNEYTDPEGPCYEAWSWLTEHAHRYGFFFPYQRYQGGVAHEPWHLSYRPLASSYVKQLTHDSLTQLLSSLNIEGRSLLIERVDWIKRQYVDNICEDNGWTNTWCG